MVACLSDLIHANNLDFIYFQETHKKDYLPSFFRLLDPRGDFFWKLIPSLGRASGILCGVRNDKFDVSSFKLGDFIVQLDLWDKSKKCKWSLLSVYGAAHEDLRGAFLAELAAFCNGLGCPYIVGGDF